MELVSLVTAVLTLWLPSLVQASGVNSGIGVAVLLGINFSVLVWFFSLFSNALVQSRGWCGGRSSAAAADGDDGAGSAAAGAGAAAGRRQDQGRGGGGGGGRLSAAGQVVPVEGELQRRDSGGAFRQLQQHRRPGNTGRQLQHRPSGLFARGSSAGSMRLSSCVQGGEAGTGSGVWQRQGVAAGAGGVEQQLREQARVATLVELQQSARVAAIAVDDVVNESPTCLQRPDLQQQQRRRPSGSQAVEAGHDHKTERRRVKKRRHRRKGKHKKHKRHHRRVQE